MKILVAEDDDVFRCLLGVILFEAGHEVVAASDGLRAWEQLTKNNADMCVFDVDMPGMTGIELLKRVRSDMRFYRLPVIMLTVQDQVKDHLNGYQSGADDYMPKPIDVEVFLARVEALGRKAGKGAS